MIKPLWSSVLCVAALLSLPGCSGTLQAYKDTLSYAINPPAGVELTLAQVQQSSADLMYFRQGNQQRGALALAFVEHNQQKWISADKVLIVMQHGRIVRTAGLKSDLWHVAELDSDPLAKGVTALTAARWQTAVDWQHDEYGYAVTTEFMAAEAAELSYFGQTLPVLKVVEKLTYLQPPRFMRFDQHWYNEYWFAAGSGQLLMSRQQMAPFQPVQEVVFISRIARLIPQGE